MENATYIALSRQTALMRQMDIVANNIANADTSGFKREQVLFEEYLAQRSADAPLSYVMDVAVVRDTQPGHMEITGREFDLAIRGDGYFVVETPAGLRYTRGGAFQLNGDREIVTSQGYRLLDAGDRPIGLPDEATAVKITRDGTVSVDGQEVARIRLVAFDDEQALRKTMSGLYVTGQEPQPAAGAEVMQGMLEGSNVRPIIEMTRMMELLRSFQATQDMLDGEHQRALRAIRVLPEAQPA